MTSFRTGAATQTTLPPIVPVDDLPAEVADIVEGIQLVHYQLIGPGDSLVTGHDTITDFNADQDVLLLAQTYYPLYEFDRLYTPTDVTTQAFGADTVAEVAAGAGTTGTLILGEVQSEVAVVDIISGDLSGTSWLAIDWDDTGTTDDIVEITGYIGDITADTFLDDAVEYSDYIGDWWDFYL